MATKDTCCTIVPYFKIHEGKRAPFLALCQEFVVKSTQEPKCLYYGWSFDGDSVLCREGYEDAAGLLAHLENVALLLPEIFKLADITQLEVHGPAQEIEKLRKPLADWSPAPRFFTLEYGFRK